MADDGAAERFHIRTDDDDYHLTEIWELYPTLFSINLYHGGYFTDSPGRTYENGRLNMIDMLDYDRFSMYELGLIRRKLGYNDDVPHYFHYRVPATDLDDGLRPLITDSHVLQFLDIVINRTRLMEVYMEHGNSNIIQYSQGQSSVVIEEITDLEAQMIENKRKNPKGLALCWPKESVGDVDQPVDGGVDQPEGGDVDQPEGDSEYVVKLSNSSQVQDSTYFNEIHMDQDFNPFINVNNAHNVKDDVVVAKFNSQYIDDFNDKELLDEGCSESEHSDANESDSDFIIDEENVMEEDEVDMRDFRFHVDVGVDDNMNEMDNNGLDVLDNDNFDSASDDNIRKKTLRNLKKAFADDGHFFLGQMFASKVEVKNLIKKHTVESRRQLKIVKDESDRIRVMCFGDLGSAEVSQKFKAGGKTIDTEKQPEKIKKGIKRKGKGPNQAQVESLGSKQKSNIFEGSVPPKHKGGRGKKKNPKENRCPWVLLVSKDKDTETWMVKTFIEHHKCLQSRCITACTSTFLAADLIDQIEENPNIPVKAVQEQFQRKYEVSVSRMKAYRARAKAQSVMHGDHTAQYTLLRDYLEELLRTNPGSTVKLDVEPIVDPNSTTRQFRRVYVCLGSLKEGFKAVGRDLLGLDGAFLKGPFPGQLLTAVGIDNNNGLYPLAYAIVEAENIHSWTWFLENIGDDLQLGSNSRFTFMSDRQKVST